MIENNKIGQKMVLNYNIKDNFYWHKCNYYYLTSL